VQQYTLGRPLTGAWIETPPAPRTRPTPPVAPSRGRGSKPYAQCDSAQAPGRPLTGAWIETLASSIRTESRSSPPHGGVDRNLQQSLITPKRTSRPLTGAWIETSSTACCPCDRQVAPSRGRGSKHRPTLQRVAGYASPPHGGVDRNPPERIQARKPTCRPLTGAWIETWDHESIWHRQACRPLTGAWIETTRCHPSTSRSSAVAPSRGRGSKL